MKAKKLDLFVLLFSLFIFSLIVIFSIIDSNAMTTTLSKVINTIYNNFGWLLNLGVLLCLFFVLYMLFSKVGNKKFGGEDAKPEFSNFTWWSISLCAGMGMGIVFWPAAECIEYAFRPATGTGVIPGTHDAFVWAEAQTINHWFFTIYAVYVAAGLIASYVYHNLKQPFSVCSMLYPIFGEKVYKYKSIIDGIVVFALVGGVAGSFGYGILQISNGISQIFGVTVNNWGLIAIATITALIFILSACSGLKKGIAWLSNQNAKMFIIILVFAMIFGPTFYSLNMGVESTGNLISNFFKYMTFTEPGVSGAKWSIGWNWLWYIDFFIFAPTTAFFLARLAKGRTVKQFILVNFLAPGLFCMLWSYIFGGASSFLQINGILDINEIILKNGHEAVMLSLFDTMPLSTFMKLFMMITVIISFVTMADSATTTASKMSMKLTTIKDLDDTEAPLYVRIIWGLLTLIITIVFVLIGGLEGCKQIKLLVGIPIFIFQIIVVIGFWRYISKEKTV